MPRIRYFFSKRFRQVNRQLFAKGASRAGRQVWERGFNFRILANELGYPRVVVVVPKRWVKSAVMRNHLKRMVRETIRLGQVWLGGVDLVVWITRNDTEGELRKQLREKLLAVCKSLGGRCE